MQYALMFQNKWPSSKNESPYSEYKTLSKRKTNDELSAIILKPETRNVTTGFYHFGQSRVYEYHPFQMSMLTLGWVYILGKKRKHNEHLLNFIRNRAFLNDIEGCTLFQWHFDSCSIDASLKLCLGRCLLRQPYYKIQQFQSVCLLKHGNLMEHKKTTSSWAFPKVTLSKTIRQDTHIQLAVKHEEWSFKNTKTSLSLLHQLDATSSLQFQQKFSSNFLLSSANIYWSFLFPIDPIITKCLICYKLRKHNCHISAQVTLSPFHWKQFQVSPCLHIGTKQFSMFFFHVSEKSHQQNTLFDSHQLKDQCPFISCGYHEDYGVYITYLINSCRSFSKDWDFLYQCHLILHSKNNVLYITLELRVQYCGSVYRVPLTFILPKTPPSYSTWLITFPQQIIQNGRFIFISLLSGISTKYILAQLLSSFANIPTDTQENTDKKKWQWLSYFDFFTRQTMWSIFNS